MEIISNNELNFVLNKLEKFNFDDCLQASLHADYNWVYYHKGFEACISCLKEHYNLKKNIDIINAMMYL